MPDHSDPIASALAEAQRHCVGQEPGEDVPVGPVVAAFLRALPAAVVLAGGGLLQQPAVLAAEVERLAASAAAHTWNPRAVEAGAAGPRDG